MWDYKGQIEKARQRLPENMRIKRSLNGCDGVYHTKWEEGDKEAF